MKLLLVFYCVCSRSCHYADGYTYLQMSLSISSRWHIRAHALVQIHLHTHDWRTHASTCHTH